MKRKLPFVRTLYLCSMIGLAPSFVFAQLFAFSRQHVPHKENVQPGSIKLRDMLLQLRDAHKVDIVFEEKILANLMVQENLFKSTATLKQNLDLLLIPAGLRYKKINENTYIVLPARDSKPKATPEKADNSAVEQQGDGRTEKTNRLSDVNGEAAPQPAERADIVVKGKVSDSDKKEGLPGVSVLLKGTTQGTITDENGLYQIAVPEKESILVFSFIGYATQEIAAGNSGSVDVSLLPEQKSLDELVVVGYGTQKKINLTGSVATMEAKQLSVVPAGNVGNMLAGNLPGLVAIQRSGEPGKDDPTLSIRGFGNALVVVDGIVGRDFYRLAPSEIESITILKDAASASVYGVSGGNGVILVTTKKGRIGKPELTYSMNYALQHVTRYPRLVNSVEFASLKIEASTNIGGAPVYSAADLEKFGNGSDPLNYPNYDYYNLYVRDYTPMMEQNLTVRGGSDKIKYFFLLGGHKATAMWGHDDNQTYKKYNFRSNVEAQITNNLTLSMDLGARSELRNDLVQDAYLMASWMQYSWPIVNPKTPDGKIQNTNYGLSGYLEPELSGYIKNRKNAFQGNLTLNYNLPFVEGLSARFTAAYDLFYQDNKDWRKQIKHYVWDPSTGVSRQVGGRDSNLLTLLKSEQSSSRIQASLNYSRLFNQKHNVAAFLLYEENEITSSSVSAKRDGYVVPIDQLFAGPLLGQTNSGTAANDGRQSLVGRATYDYMSKYLFEYSFRYDGSPRFPVENRWGFFSGVSAGWRISEENFFKDSFNAVSNLKLRGSYGESGNDNTGAFQYLAGYTYPSTTYVLGGSSVTSGLVDAGVPNPNITWEKTKMFNVGLDLGLWNRLLEIEIDVFKRQRDGLLATRALQLPSTFGATLPSENINADETKGFELVVNHANRFEGIKYNITGNVSFTKTKWTHYEQRAFTSQDDYWRNSLDGRWANRFWGLKAVGQFQSADEIKSSPIQDGNANSTLLPGDIKYEDANRDGVINTFDGQPLGRGETPEIMYGLGFNASWKKFSVTMNWQGAANFVMQMQHFLIQPFANDMSTYGYFMDRWHRANPADPTSEWIPGKYPATRNNGTTNNNQFSSFWLKDAAYIRLKSLNIGYNIDIPQLKKIGLKDVNVYISGQNLLTFTGLDYMDPETPTGRLSVYPLQKTYNVGINVTF